MESSLMIMTTSHALAPAIPWRTCSINAWPPTCTSGFNASVPPRKRWPRPAAKMPPRTEKSLALFMRWLVKRSTRLKADRQFFEGPNQLSMGQDTYEEECLPARQFSSPPFLRGSHRARTSRRPSKSCQDQHQALWRRVERLLDRV